MRQVKLLRTETDDTGTFGKISTGTFECYSLERPAAGEHPCIPAGTYAVKWASKDARPQRGPCYEITKVKNRDAILIHSANWASELLGCVAPGRSIDDVAHKDGTKVKGVTSSKDALAGFEADLGKEPFEITISWAPGAIPLAD